MKFIPLILLLACVSLAQTASLIPPDIQSERIYATIEQSGTTINLTIAIKGLGSIRGSSHRYPSPTRVTVYYTDGELYLTKEDTAGVSTRKLEGEEAAIQMLELVAFNPERFFDHEGNLLLNTTIFEEYKIGLTSKNPSSNHSESNNAQEIASIELTEKVSGTVIHRIEYSTNNLEEEPSRINEFQIYSITKDLKSVVKIQRIESNPGLPDFLFIPPVE